MATNPGNYPSDMARAVAVAMSSLSAADANNPMAIMAAAQGAVAQHTAGSMRNPFADPYDVDLGVGEEPYENPPPVMGPAPIGYPGQYGMGMGMGMGAHAPHAPHPMQDHYVGYPGQYGGTSHYPFG
jgi:hypothetical protein